MDGTSARGQLNSAKVLGSNVESKKDVRRKLRRRHFWRWSTRIEKTFHVFSSNMDFYLNRKLSRKPRKSSIFIKHLTAIYNTVVSQNENQVSFSVNFAALATFFLRKNVTARLTCDQNVITSRQLIQRLSIYKQRESFNLTNEID